jgi:hypothetical protein
MRVMALVVMSALLFSGCNNRGAMRFAGGSMLVVGTGTLSIGFMQLMFGYMTIPADDCRDDECDDRPELRRNGKIFSLTGLALMTVGLVVFVSAPKEPPPGPIRWSPPPPPPPEVVRQRAEARAVAWKWTKDLAESARAGDCERVKRRAPEVQAVDPELYATVFVRDVAIARCLAPALDPPP